MDRAGEWGDPPLIQAAAFGAIFRLPCVTVGIQTQTDTQGRPAVHHIVFLPEDAQPLAPCDESSAQCVTWLQAYLRNPRKSVPRPSLHPASSIFQQRVRSALLNMACGDVSEYGVLARELNSSARAIGQACKANPLPILVPCHRVLARHHAIGGFAGHTSGPMTAVKAWLLAHEAHDAIV